MTHTRFIDNLFRELAHTGIDVTYQELHHAVDDAEYGCDRGGCYSPRDRFERPSRGGEYEGNLDDMGQDFDRASRRGDLRGQDRITDELGDEVRWSSRREESNFDELDVTGREIRNGDIDFSGGALRRWGRDRDLDPGMAEEEAHGLVQELRQALAAEQSGRDGLEGPVSGRSVREIRGDLEDLANAMQRDGYREQATGIWEALDGVSNRADGSHNERYV